MTDTTVRRPGARSPQLRRWATFAVAVVLALITAAPILLMVSGAFKAEADIFDGSVLPGSPTWANFRYVLESVPFANYLLNSFIVATIVTVASLLAHSMAAYALARLRFPGRDMLFFGFFSTILVSMPMIIVPLFVLVRELGLLNSYPGIAAPMIFQAFALFLLRQFYLTLPDELEEQAKIDGCGPLRIYRSIALPLSRPIMAALAIFVFLGAWNVFLWPLTTTSDEGLWVVQVGIASLQGEFSGAWNYILAASTIASIPTIALFLIFQRQIIESIKTAGLK